MATRIVRDVATLATANSSRLPHEGEGVVHRRGIGGVAVSRVDGQTRAVSATCTHLGGLLQWNAAERSWDCPLHGSRFAPYGQQLEGPATRDLPTAEEDPAG